MRVVAKFGRGVSMIDVLVFQSRAAGLSATAWLEMTFDEWYRAVDSARRRSAS